MLHMPHLIVWDFEALIARQRVNVNYDCEIALRRVATPLLGMTPQFVFPVPRVDSVTRLAIVFSFPSGRGLSEGI